METAQFGGKGDGAGLFQHYYGIERLFFHFFAYCGA
jgi:hypothetical protein